MNSQSRPAWSSSDIDSLKQLTPNCTRAEIAAVLGRSPKAVLNQQSRLGLLASNRWQEWEINELRSWYDERKGRYAEPEKLGNRLGRTTIAVNVKASELGYGNRHRSNGRKVRANKFATDEERNRATSVRIRKLFAERGHPRGALGLKQSEEMKRNQSKIALRYWQTATDEQKESRHMKRNATNIELYGTANPGFENNSNPYSRGKKGYAPDLEGKNFFRSMWEANYARYLDWLKDQGEIQSWLYEPERFIFHGVTRAPVTYCPDFRIVENDGSVVFHEVKGWMDSASKSKLKRMKKHYPKVAVIVVDQPGYRALAKSVSAIVPHWDDDLVSKDDL